MKFKTAFSYVELLFGMIIVVAIFLASVPFVTQKVSTGTSVSGEFVCFSAYNSLNSAGSYRLYEAMRRGNGTFTTPVDVTNTGCSFYKQKNVNQYTVTVIGGGGAGNVSDGAKSGKNGNNGTSITITSSLAGAWDENGVLTINKCKNTALFDIKIPYEEEYRYCVGNGGELVWSKGAGAVYGKGASQYYSLLGVYHDLVYESRNNIAKVVYAGRGNSLLDATDLTLLNSVYGSAHPITTAVSSYIDAVNDAAARSAAKDLLPETAVVMRENLRSYRAVASAISQGASGEYSRFVVYDNSSPSCENGNCIAAGGLGATALDTYTTSTCSCGDAACTTANCTKNNTLATAIDLSKWNNYFGKGGLAGGSVSSASGFKYATTAPVGNGGAIVISW